MSFFRWELRFIFLRLPVTRMNLYGLFPIFILSKTYFQYLIVWLSCYKDGLCMPLAISISIFTELVRIISNAQFSVNYLLNSVVLIVLRLRFNEVVCNRLAEDNFLKDSSDRFVELGSTILLINYDHNLMQLFSYYFFRIMLIVRKTPYSKSIVPFISIYIT